MFFFKIIQEDSETQPSGEESDDIKASPAHRLLSKSVTFQTPKSKVIIICGY